MYRKLMVSIILLLLTAAPAVGQSGQDSSVRPGATDPMGVPGRYVLFPSHKLLSFDPTDSLGLNTYQMATDNSVNRIVSTDLPWDSTADCIVAAAGRITAPDREQVAFARRSGSNLSVQLYGSGALSPASVMLPGLAPRFSASYVPSGQTTAITHSMSDLMAIATGNLDRATDQQGNSHDEVVVAYVGSDTIGGKSIVLAVLDFTASGTSGMPQITAYTVPIGYINSSLFSTNKNQDSSEFMLPIDNVLALATGDFDGDGRNEIALEYVQDANTLVLDIFRYDRNGGSGKITGGPETLIFGPPYLELRRPRPSRTEGFAGSLDLKAGDFDGDGKDELITAYVTWDNWLYVNSEFAGFDTVTENIHFQAIRCNSDLTPSDAGAGFTYPSVIDQNIEQLFTAYGDFRRAPRIELAPGLFKFDPANGFGIGRRQIAAAWNPPDRTDIKFANPFLRVASFSLSDQLEFTPLAPPAIWGLGIVPNQQFSITAGRFGNSASPTDPTFSLAVNVWGSDRYLYGVGGIPAATNNFYSYVWGSPQTATGRMAAVAYDANGDSVYLGSPVHLTLDQVINSDYVLEEPPKHTYFDNLPGSPTNGQVVTVSRYDTFYVQRQDVDSEGVSNKSEDTTDWTIGGSVEASAGLTVESGGDAGIVKADAKVSADFTARGAYDYNQHQSQYTSQYASRTLTASSQTNHDDYLSGRLQTFDIWRYRLYGVVNPNPALNSFLDMVFPGPTIGVSSGGLDIADYQPVHENGNILSYPFFNAQSPVPSDVGSYMLPDGTVKNEPLVSAALQAFGGQSQTTNLQFSSGSGGGSARSYSHTLSESADVKISGSASVEDFGEGGEIRASADINFHNSNSWGGTATSDNTTNKSTSITLSQPSGSSNQGYNYYPVFYITGDGTIKAAHFVDNPASPDSNPAGAEFWASFYGRGPDPALNLPGRFMPHFDFGMLTTWDPEPSIKRKQLRGFFLRKPDINPMTNDYDYLSSTPVQGDKVRVDTRVYNYSTGVPFDNLLVRFQAVEVDQNTLEEIDPRTGQVLGPDVQLDPSLRTTIAETTVSHLDALGMTIASVVWDTGTIVPPGFSSVPAGASQRYRVYVVLDPNDTIKGEIYESEKPGTMDPGQNNEGWAYITISHPSVGSKLPGGCSPLDPRCGAKRGSADAYMKADSLAALDTVGMGKNAPVLKTGRVSAYQNQKLRLRISLYTDQSHREFNYLILYDGDPAQGGKQFWMERVHAGDAVKGTKVWVDWIPRTLGDHKIVARLIESVSDKNPGNNQSSLDVSVIAYDITAPSLSVTLSPNVLHPANGQMVPVTATIAVNDDQDPQPAVRLVSITSSEARAAAGDISGADFGTDDRSFSLRAKQTGNGPARVYTVVYSATDNAGNTTFATARVNVLSP